MDILVSGSIAYDYLMRFPGHFKEAIVLDALDKISLSFLVDEMTRHDGGVAANIAYDIALLGGRPRLLGTAGRDFTEYRQRLEAVGVDTSTTVIIEEVFTASFFASTDLDLNQIANFYAGAMGYAGDYGIFDVTEQKPDLVVISPNSLEAMIRMVNECREYDIPYLYDPSQQTPRMDGDTLRHGITHCTYVAVNEYEFELISQKTGLSQDEILNMGVTLIITRGKNGADIYDGTDLYHIPVIQHVNPVDPTGTGDAFRAGLLRGLQKGWSWDIAGRMGALMAAYVLEENGTQNHRFTLPEYITRFRENFDDEGLLDGLIETDSA